MVDPADPDRLRGYALDGIVTSTDGGRSWTTSPVPDPDTWYNAAIDPADPNRIALSARGLWVATDGATWQQRPHELQAALAWDAGDLLALYRDPDDASLRLRRSTDAGVSFVDLPMETDPHADVYVLDADAGLVASGGYRYVSGESPTGLIQLTTEAGTTVHHVAGYEGVVAFAFGDDRVVVALQGPSVMSPDSGAVYQWGDFAAGGGDACGGGGCWAGGSGGVVGEAAGLCGDVCERSVSILRAASLNLFHPSDA